MRKQQVEQTSGNPTLSRRQTYFVFKRIMDVAFTSLVLLIAAPVMLLIALLIKLDSPGPVLFVQTRVGMGGRPFRLYKFRTMYEDADHEIHREYMRSLIKNQLPEDDNAAGSTERIYVVPNDPRITRLGSILRRTSLDELPQLANVIKGDMSLVGPRPPLQYEVLEYEEWHKGRLATIPGLTGLWQVQGRGRVPFDEMVRMDLDYIARQSLWLDFKILVLTIPAVLSGKGAV